MAQDGAPQPGWYVDHGFGGTFERYWNGEDWTAQTRGLPGPPLIPQAGGSTRSRNRGSAAIAAAVAAVIGVGLVGSFSVNRSHTHTGERPIAAAAPQATGVTPDFSTWLSAGGQVVLDNLERSEQNISDAAGEQDTAKLRDYCQVLAADVHAAQAYEAVPDAEAEGHWRAALDSYAQAASDCTAGTTQLDPDALGRAADETNTGNAELSQATERIKSLTN